MKILVPTDGSDCARQTLAWAANLFDRESTEYYLIYVIQVFPENYALEADIQDATRLLNELRAALEKAGCKVARAEYLLGEPKATICGYAEEMDVDQVVIGSHGRTGLRKFLLGSISESVLAHCKKPVLVYRNLLPESMQLETPHMVPGNTIF